MIARRHPPALLLLATAAAIAPPALRAAEPAVTIENVRVGFQAGMQEGRFKVGTWTPVSVDLKGGPRPFKGFLEVEAPDDQGTPTIVRREVELSAGQFRPGYVLYARPGSRFASIKARVREGGEDGYERAGVEAKASSIDSTQQLILTAGTTRGVDELPKLPAYISPSRTNDGSSDLAVAAIRIPGGLPARAEGFDAADAIVIDAGNQELMDALDQGKDVALRDWVARSGGHLIVAVGANGQRLKDSPLSALLPALPDGQVDLRDGQVIEAWVDAKKPLAPPVKVTRLRPVEDRRPQYLLATASTPIVVRGVYGFGRVTVVGLNVAEKPFADWPEAVKFWSKVVDVPGRHAGATVAGSPAGGAFYYQGASDLSAFLDSSLERFPGVTLIPFGWVAFFVFLYILLIGPGDYFFLKKVVKRMEMTWVTFPTIVVVVSLLAYLGAYAAKGTDLKVNKLDIVDLDQTTGLSRGSSWMTLFSPQNRDYDVRVVPRALTAPEPAAGSKPGPIPANTEVNLTWFKGPESGAGGGGFNLGGSGYSYGPPGGAQQLDGVRVAIWSTRSFLARWSGPAPAALDSDLTPSGPDRLSGSVTNRLGRPLKNAMLVYNGWIYHSLGTIAPGASATLDGAKTSKLNTWVNDQAEPIASSNGAYAPYDATGNAGIDRARLARVLMFYGAGGTRSNQTDVPLRYLDLSGQADLGRPMLVAEVDGAASALDLGSAPAPKSIQQTTLLRVLLPLPPAADESPAEARETPVKTP